MADRFDGPVCLGCVKPYHLCVCPKPGRDINAISGSTLGVDLRGKIVVVRKKFFKPELREGDRRFKAEGGFGCKPTATGSAVFGVFLSDGEECRIERGDIEGLAANTNMGGDNG